MEQEPRKIEYSKETEKILERFNRDLLRLREKSLEGKRDAYEGLLHMLSASYKVAKEENERWDGILRQMGGE